MKRILLLYTGGTVGCEGQPLRPMPADRFALRLAELGLMPADVHCELCALIQPLDSANMQAKDWLDIADVMLRAWADFDGFVVLHGTDTLAYTASALSFLLAGLDKVVVLTGSQQALCAPQSDARRNLEDAIVVACEHGLREVVVCFAGNVLRGNRCIKRSACDLDAFVSPNWPALGDAGKGLVSLNPDTLLPADPAIACFDATAAQRAVEGLRQRLVDCPVWAIHLHPGFPTSLLDAALALPKPPRGWVLACYGTGNAPTEIMTALHAAGARGVVMVAVTQTAHGAVNLQTYLAGVGLAQAGVLSAGDMTLPATLVKLQILLAQDLSHDALVMMMARSLAGEMTTADSSRAAEASPAT